MKNINCSDLGCLGRLENAPFISIPKLYRCKSYRCFVKPLTVKVIYHHEIENA
jgi:hypothetical protein